MIVDFSEASYESDRVCLIFTYRMGAVVELKHTGSIYIKFEDYSKTINFRDRETAMRKFEEIDNIITYDPNINPEKFL